MSTGDKTRQGQEQWVELSDGSKVPLRALAGAAGEHLGTASNPIRVSESSTAALPEAMLFRFLDATGDGTGATDMAVDGSSTAAEFKITPAAGEVFTLERALIHVVDGGSFDSGSYGNGLALTNGIKIEVHRGGTPVLDLLDGLTILVNPDWGRHCYDVAVSSYGSGNETLSSRWTFSKSGNPITLRGDSAEELVVTIQDNLTALVAQYIQVQGSVG